MGMQSDYEKNPSFFVDAMLGNIANMKKIHHFLLMLCLEI
jgi:hypothetical protein